MRRIFFTLLALCAVLAIGSNLLCAHSAYAAIVAPPDAATQGFLSKEEAAKRANAAVIEAGYDLSSLALTETKATLVYEDEADQYVWIVCHIVKDEAEPYATTVIDATDGAISSVSRANYFELYDQWETQKGLPNNLWPQEDLVLFEAIYRRTDLYPRYILPTKADMTMKDALRIAYTTLNSRFGVSEPSLEPYERSARLMLDADGTHKWYVCFCTIESATQANVIYQVTLNAENGEVLLCIHND